MRPTPSAPSPTCPPSRAPSMRWGPGSGWMPSTTARPALVTALNRMSTHERALAARLIEGLEQIRGIQIYGITQRDRLERRAPTVSLTWPPYQPESLARWLGSHQVFTTHGDHYATELMARLGLADKGGTLRIGAAHYNTASEVDLVLELLAGYRPE